MTPVQRDIQRLEAQRKTGMVGHKEYVCEMGHTLRRTYERGRSYPIFFFTFCHECGTAATFEPKGVNEA